MPETPDEDKTHPQPPHEIQFTDAEREVLIFIRDTKRVDARWLSEEQKAKIRTTIDHLHNDRNLSLLRISKEIGKSYTAIWGLCRALEIHTRNLAEADTASAESRSKHKRTAFDGSEEDRAYMLGFKNGDLTAWQVSGTAVMVTSTTTHPAFADLFHKLFQRYSHVYQYPMFEEGRGYKWKLAARLDNSFRFLLCTAIEAAELFAANRRLYISWLAGLIDSDGNIQSSQDRGYDRVRIIIYNSNLALLESIIAHSRSIGFEFTGPYLVQKAGTITQRGIRYTKDHWQIDLQQTKAAQNLLFELPIQHSEKIERKALAMNVGHEPWNEIEAKLLVLRNGIKQGVVKFRTLAEESYRNKHGKGFEPGIVSSGNP
jgi:hypothetical protein